MVAITNSSTISDQAKTLFFGIIDKRGGLTRIDNALDDSHGPRRQRKQTI